MESEMKKFRFNFEALFSSSKLFRDFKNKRLLKKLRKQVINYSTTFSMTFYNHLKSEFEVNVRGGQITTPGFATFSRLQKDFNILQYKQNLESIFSSFKRPELSASMLVIQDQVLKSFLQVIKQVQDLVIKERKKLNNNLCSKKIREGPIVHNFTTKKVPEELMRHLVCGLNNVPLLDIDRNSLVHEIEEEAVDACRNAFISFMGTYPTRASKTNLNQEIINLLTQAPANSCLVNNLVTFREHYVNGLGQFLHNIENKGIILNDILKMIPGECIISQSDKNIGISLLPPSWYAKEYRSQILKGGYEEVSMSEEQCLKTLRKLIHDFQKNNSANQSRILAKFWPKYTPAKFRLGVLNAPFTLL